MFADILPVLIPVAGFLVITALVMRALHKREEYCQKSLKYCFWCRRKCDFFDLQEHQTERSAP